jgi:hypothetical protein
MTKTYTPPTIEEILDGLTMQNETIDMDDDDLGDEFKTPDEVKAAQTDQAIDQRQKDIDAFITAIGGVSIAANLCLPEQRAEFLIALAPKASHLKLNEDEQGKVKAALESFNWTEREVNGFMERCKLSPRGPAFNPMTMAGLLAMPPKEWLIDQLFGSGDLVMVYGAPGCGKSFWTIDMIFAACLGEKFARRFDVLRPLNVAYTAGEGISGLPSRFQAAAEHWGMIDEISNFTFFATTPQLYESEDIAYTTSITAFIKEWKVRQEAGQAQPLDILVIDTLHSATAGADENSAKDMGIVLNLAKKATQELGCAVVLVHHTNKGGTAERGSSSLRGAMDCMIEIRRISENNTGTKAVMHCAKLKDGEAWKDQTFDLFTMLDSVRVDWDEPSDGTQSKGREAEQRKVMLNFMTSQPGKKFTAKMLAEVAGIGQNNAIRILSKAVSEGQCVSELMDTTKQNSNRNPLAYFANLP